MEKKEILALICAVSAVLLFIFVLTKIRGTDEEKPAGGITVEPGEIIETGAPETDIWDVLHAMNDTQPEPAEGDTVLVTAIDDNGEVYTVTDDQGNAQTAVIPAAEPEADPTADNAAETEAPAANDQPAEPPVININPGQQQNTDAQSGEPYFVVIPADE